MPTQVNQDVGEKRTKTDDPTASKEATNSEESHVGHHQRMDSGSWAETPEVRRLTMSDVSSNSFIHSFILETYKRLCKRLLLRGTPKSAVLFLNL